MSTIPVEVKSVSSKLVAQLSAVAESWDPADIGPVIGPLYPDLLSLVASAGFEIVGTSTAWYEDTQDGQVRVHATIEIADKPSSANTETGQRFEVVELPAIGRAATALHRGPMDGCDVTYQALLRWIESNGFRPTGYGREVDIECGPNGPVVTELQIPVEAVDQLS